MLVVGGGPAGLECARVLAGHGPAVAVAERADGPGGALVAAAVGPGRERLAPAHRLAGSRMRPRSGWRSTWDATSTPRTVGAARADGWEVVLATGSRPFPDRLSRCRPAIRSVIDALDLLRGRRRPAAGGPVVIDDPVGDAGRGRHRRMAGRATDRSGHAGEPAIRWPGRSWPARATWPTPTSGSQRAGVARQLRSRITAVGDGAGRLAVDVWTGETRSPAGRASWSTAGTACPTTRCTAQLGDPRLPRAGDCVAPRTVHEAVLEGRRAALALLGRADAPDRAAA